MTEEIKVELEDLLALLQEDITGDKMPYYWSIPVYAPAFEMTLYEDNLSNMANYMVKKHGGKL